MRKLSKFETIFIKIVKKYVTIFPEHSFKFYFDEIEIETIGTNGMVIVAKYIDSEEAFERIFTTGSLGLGEIYCEGKLKIKDEDYKHLLRVFVRLAFNTRLIMSLPFVDIIRILKAKYFRPFFARKNQSENINSHYSLSDWFENEEDSNTFYLLWLVDTYKLYSCGWWNFETKTLDEAQHNKLEHYANRLGIDTASKDKTLLDLGCGWGGVLFYMAEKFGVVCHGITLSVAQADYIKKEILNRNLADLVRVDVGNIHDMSGEYDYIVSVGVMEHISDYDGLYKRISESVKENGKVLIHTMFHKDYFYKTDPFLVKYIFPGGATPHLQKNISIFKKYFTIVDLESLPEMSYPKTLDCWFKNFCENENAIRNLLKTKSKCKDVDFAINTFKHYLLLAYCGLAEAGYVGNVLAYNEK